MNYPKRLIEVDLPIRRISAHARREKSIPHGRIAALHQRRARRPLAACRADLGRMPARVAGKHGTAERLKNDCWLCVVYNCLPAGQAGGSTPETHVIRNPARLRWKPVMQIEHYHLGAQGILGAAT